MSAEWDAYSITLRDGGGTFIVSDGEIEHVQFDDGYIVGTQPGSAATIQAIGTSHPVNVLPVIMQYIAGAADSLLVGTWLNDITIVIDPVVHIEDRRTAMQVARALKQVAIFDCKRSEVVNVR